MFKKEPKETDVHLNSGNVPPHHKDDDPCLWSKADLDELDEREEAKEDAIQEAHDSYDTWKDEVLANEPINEQFGNFEGGMEC